ncbi:MAG: terminase small subunit, partial [Steroidobacteraceae bacterium]
YIKCHCAAEALRRSGYTGKRANDKAWRRMSRPEVRAAVAEREAQLIAASGANAVDVLKCLGALVRFNPKQLRDENGKLIPMHRLPDEVASAICGEKFDAAGNLIEYRTNSKNEAARTLAQHLKLIGNQLELKVPTGSAPLLGTTVVIVKPEDARAIAQDLEGRL